MKITEAKEYFEKNKVVYGISAVNGRIENSYNTDVEKFRSWDAAMSWYKKEQGAFRERWFVTKTEARKAVRDYDLADPDDWRVEAGKKWAAERGW